MKDRELPILPREATAPLLALLLLGAFWLGAKALPRREPPREQRSTGAHDAALHSAPPAESSLSALPRPGGPDVWLPSLSDQARTVLANAPLAQNVAGAGSTAQAVPGVWGATSETVGPELVPQHGGTAGGREARSEPMTPGQEQQIQGFLADRGKSPSPKSPSGAPPSPGDALPSLETPILAYEPAQRSEPLELMAREADMHSRRAFDLAGRGANFSARAEFIMALRLVAQGLDSQHRTTSHGRKLANGLTALKESEDFVAGRARLEAELNLAEIIAGHRTPVLHGASTEGLTAPGAMQHYLGFCQEQLAAACGRELAGSMALYGLGKLHALLANQPTENVRAAAPKAVAFFQASLLVHAGNYLASNDLGVLLAQAGRFEEAWIALEHSTSVGRQCENWHNLAKVCRQLGRVDRAQYAERQSAAIRLEMSQAGGGKPSGTAAVQWVEPNSFAERGRSGPASPQQPQWPGPAPKGWNTAAPTQPKRISARLPDALFENRK